MTKENSAPSPIAPFPAASVPYDTFMNKQPGTIGALIPGREENANPPKLFQPITIRGVEFPNRLWVAPMCMYSSDDGSPTDWHFVHLSSMATRGWGSIMVEATAVVPEGRISPNDMGIWKDSQIAPFKRIVDFVHANGGKIGIQLAHAGRKASTLAPFTMSAAKAAGWKGGEVASDENGGWSDDVWGPSEISYDAATNPMPHAADDAYIEKIKDAYKQATIRSKAAGFDFVEVHGAHGYWIHNWCSPLSNTRTDQYGGLGGY